MTTLTIKEQEQSISKGKKKPNRNPSKVVLCNPFEKYWPLLNTEDAGSIEAILSSILIAEKPKIKIPWKKFSKSPKSIRKQKTQEYLQQFPPSEELLRQRKIVKFGLNAVSRSIQNLKISSCILAGDIEPETILKPLIALAVIKNKPVIILPKLRQLTQKIVGFPSSALGIELPDENHSEFKLLNDTIIDTWKKFPLPANIRTQEKQLETRTKDDQVLYNIVDKSQETVNTDDIYLYRKSNDVRVFQPPAIDSKTVSQPISTALDFISLNIEPERHMYIPPNLKRSSKNSNRCRKKRKINN